MKKFLYVTIIISFIALMAGCSENKNTGNGNNDNGTITPPTNPNEITHETTIGKTGKYSITLKNPNSASVMINVDYINISNQTNTFKITDTTCGKIDSSLNAITGMLTGNQECVVNYTFTPTNLSTDVVPLQVLYNNMDTVEICNNLTAENLQKLTVIENYRIINYALDNNGNKSPEVEEVIFNVDYSISGIPTPTTYKTTKTINLDKGTYTYTYNDTLNKQITITPKDTNCTVSGNTLESITGNTCELEFDYTARTLDKIFVILESTTKNYTLELKNTSKISYVIVNKSSSWNNLFQTAYYKDYNNIFDTPKYNVMEIDKPMDYKLEGADASKFQVISAPFDGCTVTATDISLPQGKSSCFFSIDVADEFKNINATYRDATLTSSTLTTPINLQIDVVIDYLKFFQEEVCSQNQP